MPTQKERSFAQVMSPGDGCYASGTLRRQDWEETLSSDESRSDSALTMLVGSGSTLGLDAVIQLACAVRWRSL